MKVAAAVLGASLLFFLAVLTGAGRREALPPPAAIRLGVGAPASPADPSTSPADSCVHAGGDDGEAAGRRLQSVHGDDGHHGPDRRNRSARR